MTFRDLELKEGQRYFVHYDLVWHTIKLYNRKNGSKNWIRGGEGDTLICILNLYEQYMNSSPRVVDQDFRKGRLPIDAFRIGKLAGYGTSTIKRHMDKIAKMDILNMEMPRYPYDQSYYELFLDTDYIICAGKVASGFKKGDPKKIQKTLGSINMEDQHLFVNYKLLWKEIRESNRFKLSSSRQLRRGNSFFLYELCHRYCDLLNQMLKSGETIDPGNLPLLYKASCEMFYAAPYETKSITDSLQHLAKGDYGNLIFIEQIFNGSKFKVSIPLRYFQVLDGLIGKIWEAPKDYRWFVQNLYNKC